MSYTAQWTDAVQGLFQRLASSGAVNVTSAELLRGLAGSEALAPELEAVGVDPAVLRSALDSAETGGGESGDGAGRDGGGTWSREARQVLQRALGEARGEGAPELGVLGCGGAVGAALRAAGATEERARAGTGRIALRIDASSPSTITEQVVVGIREAIATDRVSPGERLPTVRWLADRLGVAPGTVARAYQELEREGLIATEGSRGTRVRQSPGRRVERKARVEELAARFRPLVVEAYHMGASAADVRSALDRATADLYGEEPTG